MQEIKHSLNSQELDKDKEKIREGNKYASKESSYLFYVIFTCIFTFLLVFLKIFEDNKDTVVHLSIFIVVSLGLKKYLAYKNKYQDIDSILQKNQNKKERIKKVNYSNSPNYIALLVIAGIKKATSSSLLFSELDSISLPQIGEKYILYDYNNPLVELETISVNQFSFGEVLDSEAILEGFYDKNEWKDFYRNLFNNKLEPIRIGLAQENLAIVSENNFRYKLISQVENKFGIINHKITDDFQIIFEKFKVTKIFTLTYQKWLEFAEEILQDNLTQDPYLNPKFDANLLLQAVTKRSKSAIFAFAETELTESELTELAEKLARRVQGEPMAYILGQREFWSLPLKVSEHTLIPRPDTERLVELTLDEAYKRLENQEKVQILDLGTGTGAIALALASELKEKAEIVGVDRIPAAVELAEQNRQNLGFKNVKFLQSDWFSALANQRFDIIVSNPPYIDADDENLQVGDVRFEPLSALVAENHGLSDLQKIIENAPLALKPNGVLLLEHGWQQAQAVQQIFKQNQWNNIQTAQDYGGNDRVTSAEWNR